MTGQTISHYKILEKIGEGGMGLVYKAEDIKLHRTVALKFLRPEAVQSRELKARFLAEAEAAAALDHPNICTVHTIDEADGETFIAMSLVEGESLAEKIRKRPLPLDRALDFAIQIADGLESAHEKGVVHRDIKPANIMVDSKGRVKITDFGLAYLEQATRITKTGTILGTPAYMSPEQVRGEKVDRRADIWSLGVVLYEMMTGRLPFRGEKPQTVALSIQNQLPEPITALRSGVPVELDRIVGKALAKSPVERYQHVGDLLVDLRALKQQSESGRKAVSLPQPQIRRFPWQAAAIMTILTLALAASVLHWISRSPDSAPSPLLKPVPLTSYPGWEAQPSLSPDGSQVAFTWEGVDQNNFDIYAKVIGNEGVLRLTTDQGYDISPAWSPDNRHIAFLRKLGNDRFGIFVTTPIGGRKQLLAEISTHAFVYMDGYLSWSPNGEWLAFSKKLESEPDSILLISLATREQRRVTTPEPGSAGHFAPVFSPDGSRLIFTSMGKVRNGYLVSLDKDYKVTEEPRLLASDSLMARGLNITWLPGGREIVYTAAGQLRRMNLSGSDEINPVTVGVDAYGWSPSGASLSEGRFVFSRSFHDTSIRRIPVPEPGHGPIQRSDPGRIVAASTYVDELPQYSPDGTEIAFISWRSGSSEVWACNKTGAEAKQLTFLGSGKIESVGWHPDGRRIVFGIRGVPGIHAVDSGGGFVEILIPEATPVVPAWTSDRKWVYFTSDRSGEREIWKRPVAGGESVRVTQRGGQMPQIPPGEQALYFLRDGGLWKIPISGGEESRVLPTIWRGSWAVVDNGVYFVSAEGLVRESEAPRSDEQPDEEITGSSIQFLEFGTGRIRELAKLDRPVGFGFSVSPDQRSILYSRFEESGADLMLVENFR